MLPEQPVALNVATSPIHKLFLLVLITGEAGLFPVLITIAFELPLSPQVLLQMAVYVPEVLTTMLLPVEPLLHFNVPKHPVALNVAVSVPHKLVFVVLITGAVGNVPVLIVTTLLAPLSPQLFTQTAE